MARELKHGMMESNIQDSMSMIWKKGMENSNGQMAEYIKEIG